MSIASVLDEQPTESFKPLIESSTYRSYQSYVNGRFPDDIPRAIKTQYEREMTFLSQVDVSKGPIKRTITRMFRIKVGSTEYLYYEEDWNAKDWKNADITPVTARIEGIHKEIKTNPKIDERGVKIGTNLVGNTDVYEIPFTKATVDRLIAETESNPDEIEFKFKNKNISRRDKCNYEQFVNTSWNQAADVLMQDGGFELAYVESLRNSSHNTNKPKS
jgi:hypothetical protein